MSGALYRAGSAWSGLSANARGAIWVSLGTVFAAITDLLVKTLGPSVHPVEMSFFRYFIGCLILIPLFVRVSRVSGLRTRRFGLHGFRALLSVAGQVLVYYAVTQMMLADVTALAFSRMLFTTLLAALLLREAVTRRRWAATFAGFVGVMIILRPGAAVIDQAALAALAAAVLFSFGLIIVPKLATTEPPDRIVFYYNVLGALLLIIPVAFIWKAPSAGELVLLLAVGLATSISMVCFIRGFAIGETSVVAPMEYVRLIYAAIIGYVFFTEVPDVWTVVGAAVIVASTLYIARRETRVRKTAKQTAA